MGNRNKFNEQRRRKYQPEKKIIGKVVDNEKRRVYHKRQTFGGADTSHKQGFLHREQER